MTISERNEVFIEYENLIRFTIYKNSTLIRALGLDYDDVSQELAISMLKAIEDYDPSKANGKKLSNFILDMLQYGILYQYRTLKANRMAANINPVSLDCAFINDEGEEEGIDIPVTVEYETNAIVNETLELLSEPEMEVVGLKMAGVRLTDDRQRRFMDRVQRKFVRYYRLGRCCGG